jgi:hypothetical protein
VQDAAQVPKALQEALVPLVLAVSRAAVAWEAAFGGLSEADRARFLHDGPGALLPNAGGGALDVTNAAVTDLVDGAQWQPALYAAAWGIAVALDHARPRLLAQAGATGFAFRAQTPIGWIVVHDGSNQVHRADDAALAGAALLVDAGGSDDYRVPAGASAGAALPVSVFVDLGGNDVYGYETAASPHDAPTRLPADAAGRLDAADPTQAPGGPFSLSEVSRQGAGRLGIGVLADLGGGDDHYKSLRMSQGFASFGVGVLHDDGGSDRYDGEAGVQGASQHGLALLLDAGGDDIYRAFHLAQGFGWVRGVGWLVDAAGADFYSCDVGDPAAGGDPLYWSPQRPGTANSSFCQGAALGLRASGAGTYWSGGLGLLRDAAGDDRYEASVFAQGAGYWFGAGVLADGGGSDAFDGIWYVQGAAAHYALGVLTDAGDGNDGYNERGGAVGVALGSGHDFGVGVLVSGGGSDSYTAGALGIGTGNCNGAGLFVDNGGVDAYRTSSASSVGHAGLSGECGGEGSPRRGLPTVGLFVDAAGVDSYARPEGAAATPADDGEWVQREAGDGGAALGEHGAGVDAAAGVTTVSP